MIVLVWWLGVSVICLAGYLFGHAMGFSNGFSQAMKENGWTPTLGGWRKETP